MRRETRTIEIGKVKIGSGHPIAVQTMTKTDTRDFKATIEQIRKVQNYMMTISATPYCTGCYINSNNLSSAVEADNSEGKE